MLNAFTLSLITELLLGGKLIDDKTPKEELAKFEGAWQVVSRVVDGRPVSAEDLKDHTVTIKGNRCDYHVGGITLEFDFEADRTRAVDFTYVKGAAKGKTLRGIYRTESDTLTVCVPAEPEGDRPTSFTSPKGSGRTLLVLKKTR